MYVRKGTQNVGIHYLAGTTTAISGLCTEIMVSKTTTRQTPKQCLKKMFLGSSQTLQMSALLNISCCITVWGWSDGGSSLWPVVMAVNTLSLLLSGLNFVSQVLYSVLKACKWREKDWIWVTLMLSSVTPLHFPGPETQGTLSSINEENVPLGLVFVKPNYIHSVGKVRINLSNPFWMCRMHHTIPRWKYPPWCWHELAEQKHCAVMVDVLPVNNQLFWPLYSTVPTIVWMVNTHAHTPLKVGQDDCSVSHFSWK